MTCGRLGLNRGGATAEGEVSSARACSVNSFTAATPVLLADGTAKPIAEVRVGDRVAASDPTSGETGPRRVERIIVHGGAHHLVDVTLADGSRITATDRHPIWNTRTRTFTHAQDLHPGDAVRTVTGTPVAHPSLRMTTCMASLRTSTCSSSRAER